jgi:TPR repeat protein
MLQRNKISTIYNPLNQSYEELLENFVIRKKEFGKIIRELKSSNINFAAQHFLIEGQRGTGKTSLLLRLKYEISHDDSLSNLVAVQFSEEQYSIFDLCRLWESTAEMLEEVEGFETLSNELDSMNADKNYSQECFNILEKYLIKNGKRLVLLLDNFGDILDKLSDIEQKRLRDIFHTSNHIQLIASSSKALEHTYRHDKPFFEFFKIIKLEGLNKEETIILLEQLSKTVDKNINSIIKNNSNRIEVIRRLTGGIPRTIVLLFEIFLDDSASVFEDLDMVLDRVTPLYKHRMDDLPTQQQAIMDTIALNWDGMTAKEIVFGLKNRGFDTKKVSSQLQLLEKNDLIISKMIDKKNKIYLIKERFFNIWYLMRYGRKKNKSQVKWLVRFLQEWCDNDDILIKAKNHIRCAKENRLHTRGGYYMAEALASIVKDNNLQHELLIQTKNALFKYDPEIAKKISPSDNELFNKATEAYKNNDFHLSLSYLNEYQHKNDVVYSNMGHIHEILKQYTLAIEYYKLAFEQGSIEAMNILASIYANELQDFESGIKYYKIAIDKRYVPAMNNLAILYTNELNDFKSAIKYFKMAIEKEDVDAMNNLAILHADNLKDYESAIKYFKMAIDKENIVSMNNLAILYADNLKDYESAIKYFKMAIDKEDTQAMNNLANFYIDVFKDTELAIQYYKMAIDKKDTQAMNNLAVLYAKVLKDYDSAIKYFTMAIDEEDNTAIFNLAVFYTSELEDYESAIKYYKMSIDKENIDAINNLAILYADKLKDYETAIKYLKLAIDKENTLAMNNLAILYSNDLKDYELAIKYFKMAVDKKDTQAMNNLANLYSDKLQDFESAVKYFTMAIEKNDINAMNNLSWLYYIKNTNKEESLRLSQQSVSIKKSNYSLHTLATVLLWNNQFNESFKIFDELVNSFEYMDFIDEMIDYFLLLISKKQYHTAYTLFEKFEELKEQFKPIYFALMVLLKDEYPKEYLKMGDELQETVDEIFIKIEDKRVKY